jgi:very-short-patch-repair endonuclease
MPEIIEFSNKHFYAPENKGLYPLKQFSENRLDPLVNIYCPDGYANGQGSNITNPVEAERIAEKIKEIVEDPKYVNKTIGVISLQGNSQSQLIENKTLNLINEIEFRNRKIICGNSASFQGDERDIIILSLITSVNHKRTSLTTPQDQRRYNVAVSRAKEQIILYHSVQLEDLKPHDLRYLLLDHFVNYAPTNLATSQIINRVLGNQPSPFDSWFEVDVYNDIVSNGFSVIPQYEVVKERYRIDLVVLLPSGVKIAIECDGDKFHGPEEFQSDLNRQKTLERCGWQFFRVRGSEYYSNRKEAMKDLWLILQQNKD